jgi:hypothetical protein
MQIGGECTTKLFVNVVLEKPFKIHKSKKMPFHAFYMGMGQRKFGLEFGSMKYY